MGVGRYLTNDLIDGRELGDWQHRLRRSPHFPVGVSYQRITEVGRRQALLDQVDDDTDPLTFGTGVWWRGSCAGPCRTSASTCGRGTA